MARPVLGNANRAVRRACNDGMGKQLARQTQTQDRFYRKENEVTLLLTKPQEFKTARIQLLRVKSEPNKISILTYYTFICDPEVRDDELIGWLAQREQKPISSYLMSERQDKKLSRAVIVKTQFIPKKPPTA